MPCACQGSKTKNGAWVYIDTSGQQHTYQTEIEALAAKVRAGNVGRVEFQTR